MYQHVPERLEVPGKRVECLLLCQVDEVVLASVDFSYAG